MNAVAEAGPLLARLNRDVGHRALFYDHLKTMIEEGSVSTTVAEDALEQLAKAALAVGVLLMRPLGVRDFRYHYTSLEGRRGELTMRPERNITNHYVRCRVQFVFTDDGWLHSVPSTRVEHTRVEELPQEHHARNKP